jgi:hypothetical protein
MATELIANDLIQETSSLTNRLIQAIAPFLHLGLCLNLTHIPLSIKSISHGQARHNPNAGASSAYLSCAGVSPLRFNNLGVMSMPKEAALCLPSNARAWPRRLGQKYDDFSIDIEQFDFIG